MISSRKPGSRGQRNGTVIFRAKILRFNEPTAQRQHTRSFNGCQRCKTRKIKCDLERPVCTTCQRRGELCDYTNLRLRTASGKKFEPPSASSPSHADISTDTTRSSFGPRQQPSINPDVQDIGASLFLRRDPRFARCCGLNDSLLSSALIPTLKCLSPASPAYTCLRAFAVMILSVSRRDSTLYSHSLQLKVDAIKRLRTSISFHVSTVETITSIVLLYTLEMSDSHASTPALQHLRALENIACNMLTPALLNNAKYRHMFDVLMLQLALSKAASGRATYTASADTRLLIISSQSLECHIREKLRRSSSTCNQAWTRARFVRCAV